MIPTFEKEAREILENESELDGGGRVYSKTCNFAQLEWRISKALRAAWARGVEQSAEVAKGLHWALLEDAGLYGYCGVVQDEIRTIVEGT